MRVPVCSWSAGACASTGSVSVPDPGLCLECDTFRRYGEIHVPCEGHLAACCRVSALLQCSLRVSQQCNSARVFFFVLDFFWCVKTVLACPCASSHWHFEDLVCTRFTRVWLSLSWDTCRGSPCASCPRVFAFVPTTLSRLFFICEVAFGWCRCVSFVRTCLSG